MCACQVAASHQVKVENEVCIFGGYDRIFEVEKISLDPNILKAILLVFDVKTATDLCQNYNCFLTFILFALKSKSTICFNKLNQQSHQTTTWGIGFP